MKLLTLVLGLSFTLTAFAAEKKQVYCLVTDPFYRKVGVEFIFSKPLVGEVFLNSYEGQEIKIPSPEWSISLNREYKNIRFFLGVEDMDITSVELPRAMFNPDEENTTYSVRFWNSSNEDMLGTCEAVN